MGLQIIENVERKKRKRFNKNKKKSWKKNIDITDIEDLPERKHRELICQQPISELFTLDGKDNKRKTGSAQKKKISTTTKTLRCHKYLDGLPGVKVISKKKPPSYQRLSKVLRTARNRSGNTLKDEVRRLMATDQRKVSRLKVKKPHPKLKKCVKTDIWSKEKEMLDQNRNYSKSDVEFLQPGLVHFHTITKTRPIKVPRKEKPSLIPAIILPDSGTSYNPTFDEHQKLMKKVIKDSNKKDAIILKKDLAFTKAFPRSNRTDAEKIHLKEMSEGLYNDEEESDIPQTSNMKEVKKSSNPIPKETSNEPGISNAKVTNRRKITSLKVSSDEPVNKLAETRISPLQKVTQSSSSRILRIEELPSKIPTNNEMTVPKGMKSLKPKLHVMDSMSETTNMKEMKKSSNQIPKETSNEPEISNEKVGNRRKITSQKVTFAKVTQSSPSEIPTIKKRSLINEEEEEEEEVAVSISAGRITQKKSKQQRKKERRMKIINKQKETAKKRRIMESDVYRAKTLTKELKCEEEMLLQRKDCRLIQKELNKYKTKRLSKNKFEEVDTVVPLGDDLPDTLRLLSPMGNLLEEHLKSLQRRNMIPVKGRSAKQKKMKKDIIKRSKSVSKDGIAKIWK